MKIIKKEALEATKTLGVPAVGFKKVDGETVATKVSPILVKQNNLLIYLIVKLSKKIESLETRIARLEANKAISTESPEIKEALEQISQGINKLKIAEKGDIAPPPAITRKIYHFINPQEIFDSEKKKLERKK